MGIFKISRSTYKPDLRDTTLGVSWYIHTNGGPIMRYLIVTQNWAAILWCIRWHYNKSGFSSQMKKSLRDYVFILPGSGRKTCFELFHVVIPLRAAKPRPPEGGLSGNAKLERTFMTCHVHKERPWPATLKRIFMTCHVKKDIHDWPR